MEKTFSKNVARIADKNGQTLSSLGASLSGRISKRRLASLVHGKATPTFYEAYCLAKALKVPLDFLAK